MRLPRVRFRIRSLMAAVAIVALLMAAAIMARRSREFAGLASFHAAEEAQCEYTRGVFAPEVEEHLKQERKALEEAVKTVNWLGYSRPDPSWMKRTKDSRRQADEELARVDALARQRDYHADLKRKYQRAASHPWERLSPDPPEPPYPQFGDALPPDFQFPGSILIK